MSDEYTLSITVTDDETGDPITDATVEITQTDDHTGGDEEWDYETDADDQSEIQSALSDAESGETVRVDGDGSYTWDESLEVPNGVTLDVSNDVSATVPSSNNVTGYSIGSRTVYSLITCEDRSGASDVTIRGGEYDMSAMTDSSAGYAGIWLHEATDSVIEDVSMTGAGEVTQGSSNYRGFGLALTACTESDIIDSEAYDSGYDDIGIRGGNVDCRVIRSGGSGGSSGTIQTALWGHWNLTTRPEGTEYIDCWGRRIYCHSGIDTVWDGCESHYRLQTIGVGGSATFRNSEEFEGKVLLYTLDDPQPYTLVENMEFVNAGEQSIAIQIGPNSGQDIGDVDIDDVWAERPTFLHFNDYSTDATIDTVEVTDSELYGAGSGAEIVSYDSGVGIDTLTFRNCEFDDFDTGIVGSYNTVIVEDCTFHSLSESEAIDVDADVQTSGNTYA